MPLDPVHRKARQLLSEVAPAVCAHPTTWPLWFTAAAVLDGPPSVPRSTMPPLCVHRNACAGKGAVPRALVPTTWPRLLLATGRTAPPSVPMSIHPPVAVHTSEPPLLPRTCPTSLIAVASLKRPGVGAPRICMPADEVHRKA